MKRTMIVTLAMASCPLFLSWACAHQTPADAAAIPGRVAETFAKAAVLIFDPDHVDCDKTVSEAFSAEELEILGSHRSKLESMIESALGRQESVWGAKLAGHYRLESLRSLLQSQFLAPRRCYGWEGPDYSRIESDLTDNQYPYSVVYLEALEAITGRPIARAIGIGPPETDIIDRQAGNEKSEYYPWALWVRRKLNLEAISK